MPSSQLVLDFEHRPALGGEDFLVAPCNEKAVAWIDRWPDWTSPAMVLYGDGGCGKSHLAQVFQAKTKAVAISRAELMEKEPPTLLGEAPACLLEDMDRAFEGYDSDPIEEALLHLYNTVRENGATLLMTAATPPSRWLVSLRDLSSRLKTATAVEIGPPDDALLAAVLVKQFADRQLRIDGDVVAYVQPRIERSFAAIGRLVAGADSLALVEKRRITVPLVRRVLDEINVN